MEGDEVEAPSFPPLLSGVETGFEENPFQVAVNEAADAEPGSLYWSPRLDVLQAAILFAPDRPLGDAMAAVFVIACGLHDCLGALAPPETSVQHVWPNRILVNGGACGTIFAAAPSRQLDGVPNWLVAGLELELAPIPGDPGSEPDRTSLAEEGCGGLSQRQLLESWSRHTMAWIHRWTEDGTRPLFESWLVRAAGKEEARDFRVGAEAIHGRFLGLGEQGSLLVRSESETREFPLAAVLDHSFPDMGVGDR